MDFGELLKYLLLGALQGITEVLPISSSGHIELAKMILNLQADEGLLFLIVVNTGSLIVFLIIYSKDLLRLIRSFFAFLFKIRRDPQTRTDFFFVLKIVIATVPAALVGVFFNDLIDHLLVQYGGLLSGIGLLFTGTVLYLVSQQHYHAKGSGVSTKNAIFAGLAQAVAILPGVSRAGMTTAAGLKGGVGIDDSLRFSFLLYIPISLGSLAMTAFGAAEEGLQIPVGGYHVYYYAAAFVASVIFTAIAFKVVFPAFRSGKLKYFSFYCFFAGALSMVLFLN